MNDKQKLLELLRNHLSLQPGDTREFMEVCIKSMDEYINKSKKENDATMFRALRDATMYRAFGTTGRYKFALLLESNFIVFRKGWEVLGDASSMWEEFLKFVEEGIEYGLLQDPHAAHPIITDGNRRWLDMRGGKEMVEWAESIFCVPDLLTRLEKYKTKCTS